MLLANQLCQMANSNVQATNRMHLRSSVICSIFVLACMLSPTLRAQITVNGASSPTYMTIAAAFASPSPCTSGNCEIEIPPGTWPMSTTISLTSSNQNITIKCLGSGWKNNGSTRGPTTITWTGGAAPMFMVTGVNGFTMKGCNLDNTGSATEAVRISVGHDITFDEISISPTSPFSTDAISCQNGGNANVRISIKNSFLLTGAPILVDCDRFNIFNVINTLIGESSGSTNIRIGNTIGSYNFNFTDSDCESLASATSTQACIDLNRLEGGSITGSYFEVSEGGTAAGQLAIRLPNLLVSAVNISGNRFAGNGNANYGIETNGATGVVIQANSFNDFATGGVNFKAAVSDTTFQSNVANSGTPNLNINFKGTATFTTASVNAGACQTAVTTAQAGVTTGMPVQWSFTSAPVATTDSLLVTNAWTTAGNVVMQRCNPTAGTLVPSALVANWKVN